MKTFIIAIYLLTFLHILMPLFIVCGKPLAVRLNDPYREKLDRSSANQITGFSAKPDEEKIKFVITFLLRMVLRKTVCDQINPNSAVE